MQKNGKERKKEKKNTVRKMIHKQVLLMYRGQVEQKRRNDSVHRTQETQLLRIHFPKLSLSIDTD